MATARRRKPAAAKKPAAKKPAAKRASGWHPSPPALAETFQRLIASEPLLQPRKMFGYPAAFVRGNLCASLFQDSMILRLGDADRDALLAQPGARPFEPMPGRRMRQYVVVPRALLDQPPALRAWLKRAVAFASALPAK